MLQKFINQSLAKYPKKESSRHDSRRTVLFSSSCVICSHSWRPSDLAHRWHAARVNSHCINDSERSGICGFSAWNHGSAASRFPVLHSDFFRLVRTLSDVVDQIPLYYIEPAWRNFLQQCLTSYSSSAQLFQLSTLKLTQLKLRAFYFGLPYSIFSRQQLAGDSENLKTVRIETASGW